MIKATAADGLSSFAYRSFRRMCLSPLLSLSVQPLAPARFRRKASLPFEMVDVYVRHRKTGP